MDEQIETETLISEIRYAERLCIRTARLYRKASTTSTFLSIIGGSAILSALSDAVPSWVSLAGAGLFAVFGALSVAVRPDEKAAHCRRRREALRATPRSGGGREDGCGRAARCHREVA